jgi:hypothetical protein
MSMKNILCLILVMTLNGSFIEAGIGSVLDPFSSSDPSVTVPLFGLTAAAAMAGSVLGAGVLGVKGTRKGTELGIYYLKAKLGKAARPVGAVTGGVATGGLIGGTVFFGSIYAYAAITHYMKKIFTQK